MGQVSVWLLGFQDHAADNASANLQQVFGIDHVAARELVGSLPQPVKHQVSHEDAQAFISALEAIGGRVEVRSTSGEQAEPHGVATTPTPGPDPFAPPQENFAQGDSPPAEGSLAPDWGPEGRAPSMAAGIPAFAAASLAAGGPHGPPASPQSSVAAEMSPRVVGGSNTPQGTTTRPYEGQVCAAHRDQDAKYYCPHCDLSKCSNCVQSVWQNNLASHRCRQCNNVVEHYALPQSVGTIADYVAMIPEMFQFPFQRSVLMVLIGLSLLMAPLDWAIGNNASGILAQMGRVIRFGIEASVYFHLLRRVAFGSKDFSAPDFTDFYDDIIAPLWNLVFAFIPVIAAMIWAAVSLYDSVFSLFSVDPKDVFGLAGPAFALAVALLLLPLTTIIAAMSASRLQILNPVEWVKTLQLIGWQYPIGAGLFYVVFFAEVFVLVQLQTTLLAIPVLGRLIGVMVVYTAMAIRAKILGSLCVGKI